MKYTTFIIFIYFLLLDASSVLAIGPYTDQGETILDQATGLVWEQQTGDVNGDGSITTDDKATWQEALAYCEELTFAGEADWRLPNIRELKSLVDYTKDSPAIDSNFDSLSSYYWSASQHSLYGSSGWIVNFYSGDDSSGSKLIGYYVRCVRGSVYETFQKKLPGDTIPISGPYYTPTEFGILSSTGSDQFNPDQDLFVISHGWNPTDPVDPVNTDLPLWEVAMAIDLKNQTGNSGGNVLKWNWQQEAASDHAYNPISGANLLSDSALVQLIFDVPYDKVRDSGKYLSEAIRNYLHNEGADNYTGSIHMIGHSLGSGVVIQAALRLSDIYNVKQLTLLDSPWYVFGPSIRELKLRSFFIDNYYTMLGRPQGYNFANVNVWIESLYSKFSGLVPFSVLSKGHQLAHQWYRSSITNFQDTSIIGFDDSTPSLTQKYGFYWHDHQTDVPKNMFHIFGEPYWKLRKGIIQVIGEYITDAANALSEIKQNTKDAMEDFAISTAINVTIVAANTLNKVEDTADFVTDAAGHAFWVFNSSTGNGFLKLILNSEAFLSVPVTIHADATSMQFNYEFLSGCDPQTQLEVYLSDKLVFTALAGDVFETGEQFSGWINVMDYAGQQTNLTYRLSNPVDGPLGEIALDDIIFVKLSSLDIHKNIGFSWPMFLPAITGGK